METTTIDPQQEVRASVNEKAFFTSMKHLFASSFSVLSEMLQNSRRAGASFVSFDLNIENKKLIVTDDGCGISDFGALVSFCESGWDEQTILKDQPYGMGFFSLFFACSNVIVRSAGKKLSIGRDDIINKRAIRTVTDDSPVVKGAIIELHALEDDLLGMHNSWLSGQQVHCSMIQNKLEEFARGFAIKVIFNGAELERPHAQDVLAGKITQYGKIHVAHIHGSARPETMWGDGYHGRSAYYLQGLPIQTRNELHATLIVHLDSLVFTPQMPDRQYLYNGKAQLEKVTKEAQQLKEDFLAERKLAMNNQEFAKTYWSVCRGLNLMRMFNDIEILPNSALVGVNSVADTIGYQDQADGFLSRSDIVNGKVTVWRDDPVATVDVSGPYSAVFLKVIQRNGILVLDKALDEGHWIHKVSPSCNDMEVTIEPGKEIGRGSQYIDSHDVDIILVENVTVRITSKVDPEMQLVERIDNDWIMHCVDEDEINDFDVPLICYVTAKDESPDHPVGAISDFLVDSQYDERWEDGERVEWQNTVRTLLGLTLAQNLGHALEKAALDSTAHLGQLALVTAQQTWMPNAAKPDYGYPRLAAIDLEDEKVWTKLAAMVAKKQKVTGLELKDMFTRATGAQAQVGKPARKKKAAAA